MSFEEEIKQKQQDISNLTRHGDWYGSYIGYQELLETKKEHFLARSKMIKFEVEIYCKVKKISFKDFCFEKGFDKYYLEKVMKGYIRPSDYFVNRILRAVSDKEE